MKNALVKGKMKWTRIEGLLLGAGLVLLILGAAGMFFPTTAIIPMDILSGGGSWGGQSGLRSRDFPVRMLPSQFVEITINFVEGANESHLEVWALINYQTLTKGLSITIYHVINQTNVNFIFSWANATYYPFSFITGFFIRIFGEGAIRISYEIVIQWFGDFTYFAGLALIVISAIPFWGYLIASYYRRRQLMKVSKEDWIPFDT